MKVTSELPGGHVVERNLRLHSFMSDEKKHVSPSILSVVYLKVCIACHHTHHNVLGARDTKKTVWFAPARSLQSAGKHIPDSELQHELLMGRLEDIG